MIEAARAQLLVVDVQDRLAPHVAAGVECIRRIRALIQAARRLAVPVLVTEQYPEGLGRTVADLQPLLAPADVCRKVTFAAAHETAARDRVLGLGRPQLVIAGMEAHVCVLQTALSFKAVGLQPFVVADAVGSRTATNRTAALSRLQAEGVRIVTSEMVLFEWLGRAGTDVFRAVLPLIKEVDEG